MFHDLRRGLLFTLVSMALVGVYHVALWGLGRVAFPAQAEGSLIRNAQGVVTGSSLVAQRFGRPEYFHPRPSGVDYNAASTGGTNYGPSNPDHLTAVQGRLDTIVKQEGVPVSGVPSEMVTASGAGLDPHIPPTAAAIQSPRVTAVRKAPLDGVHDLIRQHTEPPTFGFLGRARVNVLELNLALDAKYPVAANR